MAGTGEPPKQGSSPEQSTREELAQAPRVVQGLPEKAAFVDIEDKATVRALTGVRDEVHQLRGDVGDLRGDVGELRTRSDKLQNEMHESRGEMREFRGEMKAEMGENRGEMKAEMGENRGEMKAEMGEMRGDIRSLERVQDMHSKLFAILIALTFGLITLTAGGFFFVVDLLWEIRDWQQAQTASLPAAVETEPAEPADQDEQAEPAGQDEPQADPAAVNRLRPRQPAATAPPRRGGEVEDGSGSGSKLLLLGAVPHVPPRTVRLGSPGMLLAPKHVLDPLPGGAPPRTAVAGLSWSPSAFAASACGPLFPPVPAMEVRSLATAPARSPSPAETREPPAAPLLGTPPGTRSPPPSRPPLPAPSRASAPGSPDSMCASTVSPFANREPFAPPASPASARFSLGRHSCSDPSAYAHLSRNGCVPLHLPQPPLAQLLPVRLDPLAGPAQAAARDPRAPRALDP